MKQFTVLALLTVATSIAKSQPTTFTDSTCLECNNAKIAFFNEIDNKYLGVKGKNPSRPSTYNLLGANKFAGCDNIGTCFGQVFVDGLNIYSNWYPFRLEKQILCGTVNSFGVSNYGDESDWNINLLPNGGFESFIADALEYSINNPFAAKLYKNIGYIPGVNTDWSVTTNGEYLIEAEITPRKSEFNNRLFNNVDGRTTVNGKMIGVYGPFVGEALHGIRPEIHPSEQIWWKEDNNKTMILLVCDASNRFDNNSDYTTGNAEVGWKPWAQDVGQEAELLIPFKLNPKKGSLHYSVQALETPNFYEGANYADAISGITHSITFNGNKILTVEESLIFDKYIGITFKEVCYKNDTLRGLIVIKTAIGNGSDGKEGFAALQIDKLNLGLNPQKGLVIGNIIDNKDNWSVYNKDYDDSKENLFTSAIISSDKQGKGIVDGMIDFNGNGITDLFTSAGGKWLVMYDAKGKWTEINTSGEKLSDLRFGNIDGDRKTDIMYVTPNDRLYVSFGGTERWKNYSHVEGMGDDYPNVRVGDFNGDGKTDIIKRVDRSEASTDYEQINIDIKYSCSGEWKRLESGFEVYVGDWEYRMRFGDFNGDGITDIFRYYQNKFQVYWSGRGSLELLCDPLISKFNVANDLLFVNSLSKKGFTDIIYVKESTKAWKIYYEGKTTLSGRILKYNDSSILDVDNTCFGNFNPNQLWEPITMDYIPTLANPELVSMGVAAKVKREPFILYNYKKGSIKSVLVNNIPSLSFDMDAVYYAGNSIATKTKNNFKAVSSAKMKSGLSQLVFKQVDEVIDNKEVIGRIENVPLSGVRENEIQIKYAADASTSRIQTPAYGIGVLKSKVEETINGVGSLNNWRSFITDATNPSATAILLNSPNKTELIKNITWELFPFYSGIEDNKINIMEMPAAMQELNAIAYGKDIVKTKEIFGSKNVFDIAWDFVLTDLTTGLAISVVNPISLTSNGMWANNKIIYSFPETNNLLELKVSSSVKDKLGNNSLNSDVFTFYNQRIKLDSTEIKSWVDIAFSTNKKVGERFKKRANFNSKDFKISPLELKQLIEKQK